MAIHIRIYQQGSFQSQISFDKPLVRVGRSSECEISIPDPTVSGTHCILRKKEEGWFLEDLSKNGIQSEAETPLPQRLKIEKRERIQLGRLYSLEIDPQPLLTPQISKTLIIHETPTQLVQIEDFKVTTGKAMIRHLSDEGGVSYPVDAAGLSIGSHAGNDIVISNEKVSQFHARLEFSQNEFLLTDLGSTNGTFLNENRIQKASLRHDSKIQIGDTVLDFIIENKEMKIEPRSDTEFMGILSTDKTMRRLFSICEVVAGTEAPVFIHGETGTGKELFSKAIHDLSPRFAETFVPLNCAALPKDLIESELFGHEKGAFTGALSQRAGAFETADKGTLFLDEVAELDSSLQAKLLRALETGEIKRVGASKPITVSVRVVSATHKDLAKEVEAGRFREDLYYRLHVVPIQIPPLRERREDLDLLIPYLLKELDLPYQVDNEVVLALKKYDYPGNVRELKNILQRAGIEYQINLNARGSKRILYLEHFRFLDEIKALRPARTPAQLSEKEIIQRTLDEVRGNQSEAARRLNLPISTFHDRLKRYGLWKKADRFPPPPPPPSISVA